MNVAGTINNISGDTDPANLAITVSWWVSNVGAFAPIMDRIATNIANKWEPRNSPAWATANEDRTAARGRCVLVIDSGNYGQDPYDFPRRCTQDLKRRVDTRGLIRANVLEAARIV
jgi:hypothetical protein